MTPCVYMMASKRKGTLYTGVTSDLPRRAYEHREGLAPGFTRTYACKMLVWYEAHDTMLAAIQREKTIKHYVRQWKLNLIEELNPNWDDLYETLNG
ncbi:MAG: GIY-YIG nuclease family protein [Alphaproteobacteria bacterium]